jgi:hypothetical protein
MVMALFLYVLCVITLLLLSIRNVYSVNYFKPSSSEFPYQRKLYSFMGEMEYVYIFLGGQSEG